jgi:hypothetical protein
MSARRIAGAVTGLGVGLIFYLGYRSDHTVSNRLLRWLCGQSAYEQLQHVARDWLPIAWSIRGSLPSALWCFIATSLIGGWKIVVTARRTIALAWFCPLFNGGWEIIQYLRWTDGHADTLDVAAGFVGWTLAEAIFRGSDKSVAMSRLANWRMGVVATVIACMGFADVWR